MAPAAYQEVTWAGPYIGGHVGAGRMNSSVTEWSDPGVASYGMGCAGYYGGGSCDLNDTGVIGGVHAGWNWQSGVFVYGVEGDWTWTDLKHTIDPFGYYTYGMQSGVDWLASIRGRMGLAVDNTLVYATAGVAFGNVNGYTYDDYNSNGYGGSIDKTKVGWVAGLGVEHKLQRNWSVRGEVLYYDLGNESFRSTGGPGADACCYTTQFSHEVLTARFGVSYHW